MTGFEELSPEKQADVRRIFAEVAEREKLSDSQRADLALLLGMPSVPRNRTRGAMSDVWLKAPISDERLEELYEVFAERAATPTTSMKEDIDVMRALGELQERRAAVRTTPSE